MLGRTKKWEERRKLLTARKPTIRIDSCTVTKDKARGYRVEISGLGMNPAVSPPSVTVGGETIPDVRFEPGGRRIIGFITYLPEEDDRVVVDLGYARAEGIIELR